MYLGKWVAQCAVHDNKGQHCPDTPVHYVEYRGERVGLCERCFLNFQNGAFDHERVKRINIVNSAEEGVSHEGIFSVEI